MSLVTLGARGAALALTLLCLAPASPAFALTTFMFSCTLDPQETCEGGQGHTYDTQRAIAPLNRQDAYIASWFTNPSTGNGINVTYGWGAAGGDYRYNPDLVLKPWIGNFSQYYAMNMTGKFEY